MKKGFTMIELIFVIVILGILASVAIPRLAATREDAEISTTIANLRTLVSEASAYYVAHGTFTGANWNAITNVPLNGANTAAVSTAATGATATPTAHLQAGNANCIGVRLVNKNGNTPAHIVFTRVNPAPDANSVCAQVVASQPVNAYLTSTSGNGTTAGTVAVGSSTGIYRAAPQPENNNRDTGTGTPTTNGVGAGG